MPTIEQLLSPVRVFVNLRDGGCASVITDTRWKEKMEGATVHPFTSKSGDSILYIVTDPDGNSPQPNDKDGMSVPHYLTGQKGQYHYRDNNSLNCTTSNFGSRHEKHHNNKFN